MGTRRLNACVFHIYSQKAGGYFSQRNAPCDTASSASLCHVSLSDTAPDVTTRVAAGPYCDWGAMELRTDLKTVGRETAEKQQKLPQPLF